MTKQRTAFRPPFGAVQRWLALRGFEKVAAVAALALAAFLLYPILTMVLRTFVTGSDVVAANDVVDLFRDARTLEAIRNTAVILIVAVPMALVIGGLLAWLNERTDARFGLVGEILPIASLLVPPIAGSIAWTFLLSPTSGYLNVLTRNVAGGLGITIDHGPINIFSWYGVIATYTVYMVPYAYLPIAASLRSLDPSLEEAARVSGSSPLKTIWNVTIPAIRPALLTALFLTTVIGLGLYSIPSILGTRSGIDVVSVLIVQRLKFSYPPDTQGALMLGFLLLAVIGAIWLLQSRASRKSTFATISSRGQSESVVRLGSWRKFARLAMVLYLAGVSVVPFVGLAFVSLQRFWTPHINWGDLGFFNYSAVLGDSGLAADALRNSVVLASVGATVGVLLASLAAFHLRRDQSRFGRVLDAVLKLPGNMSHIVLALAFVLTFAGDPFNLGNTRLILLLAYIVIYMYQAILQASDAFGRVGDDLINASYTSGHGQGRTMRWVVLPLMAPGLVSAWILYFVHIVADVNASAILAGTKTQVVGSALVGLHEGGVHAQLAALATILCLISVSFVLGSLILGRLISRRL